MKDIRGLVDKITNIEACASEELMEELVETIHPMEIIILEEVVELLEKKESEKALNECKKTLDKISDFREKVEDIIDEEERNAQKLIKTIVSALAKEHGSELNLETLASAFEVLQDRIENMKSTAELIGPATRKKIDKSLDDETDVEVPYIG